MNSSSVYASKDVYGQITNINSPFELQGSFSPITESEQNSKKRKNPTEMVESTSLATQPFQTSSQETEAKVQNTFKNTLKTDSEQLSSKKRKINHFPQTTFNPFLDQRMELDDFIVTSQEEDLNQTFGIHPSLNNINSDQASLFPEGGLRPELEDIIFSQLNTSDQIKSRLISKNWNLKFNNQSLFFNILPPEMEDKIMSLIEFPALLQASQVSKAWYHKITPHNKAVLKKLAMANIEEIFVILHRKSGVSRYDGSYRFSFTLEKATGKIAGYDGTYGGGYDFKPSTLDTMLTEKYEICALYENTWQENLQRDAYTFIKNEGKSYFSKNPVTCPADSVANEMLLILNKTAEFALQRFTTQFWTSERI